MGFFKQKYWTGLPCPFPGDLPDPGIEPASLISPTMEATQVQSLGREDSLEKEMATRSRILAWEIPWIEKPGGLQSMGLQRVGHN